MSRYILRASSILLLIRYAFSTTTWEDGDTRRLRGLTAESWKNDYPECSGRIEWMLANWKTSPWSDDYLQNGVDGTFCSIQRYLATVESFCPQPAIEACECNGPFGDYLECEWRLNWMMLNWDNHTSTQSYINAGVDGSRCSMQSYLNIVENKCPPIDKISNPPECLQSYPTDSPWGECVDRKKWLMENWDIAEKSDFYKANGVDGSECSMYKFLANVEIFCPNCHCTATGWKRSNFNCYGAAADPVPLPGQFGTGDGAYVPNLTEKQCKELCESTSDCEAVTIRKNDGACFGRRNINLNFCINDNYYYTLVKSTNAGTERVPTFQPTQYSSIISSCEDVWDQPANGPEGGSYTCGDRIVYMQTSEGYSETDAKNFVACEIPSTCGVCRTEGFVCPTLAPTSLSTSESPTVQTPPTPSTSKETTVTFSKDLNVIQVVNSVVDNNIQIGGTARAGLLSVYLWKTDLPTNANSCPTPSYTGGAWPLVFLSESATFDAGLNCKAQELTGSDSKFLCCQTEYGWLPMYQYAGDNTEADINGEGLGEVWYSVPVDMKPTLAPTSLSTSESPTVQTPPTPSTSKETTVTFSKDLNVIQVKNSVVDNNIQIGGTARAGLLSVYLWKTDLPTNANSCPTPSYTGGAWPLVFLSESATFDAGLNCKAQELTGSDSKFLCCQTEYGWLPMYQYAGDNTEADINGEGLGEVWYSIPVDMKIDMDCPQPSANICTPPNAQDWVIGESCTIGTGSYSFRKIIISNQAVVRAENSAEINFNIRGGILVENGASLWIGCEENPFQGQLLITFSGVRADLSSSDRWLRVGRATWANALVVSSGSRLEIHGKRKSTWHHLAESVNAGSNQIRLDAAQTGWEAGDELVIAQTGRDKRQAERRVIESVNGNVVTLTQAVSYFHEGSFTGRGLKLNAEVGMVSYNVKFTSTFDLETCNGYLDSSNYNEAAKNNCFGGNTAFLMGSVIHVEHAEFEKMGQALTMGRYALHFHLAGDQSKSYLRNLSVHRGANRCVTIHGSFYTTVQNILCLDNRGHNLYLEDGIEAGNIFSGNLVINPKKSHTVCTDNFGAEGGASGLWITNPNNTFIDNTVVGADFGAWFTFPTKHVHAFNFPGYPGEHGGVFGPSQNFYTNHPEYGPDHWIMNQEQARTPIVAFDRNAFKGSVRSGITIDFRVYDSEDYIIPCSNKNAYSESECPTCANVGHTFEWAPAQFDISVAPAQRVYVPVKQDFNDIVIAYQNQGGGESFSVWATGGVVNFVRPVLFDNIAGMSLGHAGHCAGGMLGAGGTNIRLEDALFINGNPPFKLYDGGYYCYNCRWANTQYLVTMRPGSPGNINGLILEKSAPLGWIDADRTDPLFSWVFESNQIPLTPRAATDTRFVDLSSRFIQNAWEADYVMIVSVDGFAGTIRNGQFTQWIPSRNPQLDQGWGPGTMINDNPQFRQFQPCRPGRGECYRQDLYDCTPHFNGQDILNAPW